MSELVPGQLEIDGLRVGTDTSVILTDLVHHEPDVTTNDRGQATGDGRSYGRDTFGGRTIDLGLTVDEHDPVSAARTYTSLATVWHSARARAEEDAFVTMRMRPFPEIPTRVVYGRPRRFTAVNDWLLAQGSIQVVAEFDTVDPLYYADPDAVDPLTISITPPQTGGFAAPFASPIVVATTSSGFGTLEVPGSEATPLVARIHGPCTNPVVDVLGVWQAQLLTSLLHDQWIDIDARPWVRQVRRSDGANAGGAFSAASPPLSELTLPPGRQEVVLRGIDPTGTASLTVSVQGAGASPYWL